MADVLKKKKKIRTQTYTVRRPCKETARRWSSISQKERPKRKSTLSAL